MSDRRFGAGMAGAMLTAVLAAPCSTPAATLRVPWQYATVQGAIDASVSGDTILVAPGVYTACDDGDCLPATADLKTGITLLSEGGPSVTTLRADDSLGWPSGAVIDARGLGPDGATVNGFRITSSFPGRGGINALDSRKLTVTDCVFEDLTEIALAMSALDGDLEVRGCAFTRCEATEGPAAGVFSLDADVLIENCTFEDCISRVIVIDGEHRWTGVVRDCEFRDNTSPGHLVSVIEFEDFVMDRCGFYGGATGNVGVALSSSSGGSPYYVVSNCVFYDNQADPSYGGALGFGIGLSGELTGNTFVRNGSPFFTGSAQVTFLGEGLIANNIFAESVGDLPALESGEAPIQSSCNLFWDNPGGDYIDYVPSDTDVFVDPRFCDSDAADLTLMADSPCLPENSNGCGLIGALGEGCGTVAIESESWGKIKSRFRPGGGGP